MKAATISGLQYLLEFASTAAGYWERGAREAEKEEDKGKEDAKERAERGEIKNYIESLSNRLKAIIQETNGQDERQANLERRMADAETTINTHKKATADILVLVKDMSKHMIEGEQNGAKAALTQLADANVTQGTIEALQKNQQLIDSDIESLQDALKRTQGEHLKHLAVLDELRLSIANHKAKMDSRQDATSEKSRLGLKDHAHSIANIHHSADSQATRADDLEGDLQHLYESLLPGKVRPSQKT